MTRETQFRVLAIAGLYNILWGTIVVLFPLEFFNLTGMEVPNYPEIWQCVGMIVAVYGLGYIIAATDPFRHWPIILVGLLGKVFGPIGFLDAILRDRFTLEFGINIIFNDLIWWYPFGKILYDKYQDFLKPEKAPFTKEDAIKKIIKDQGNHLIYFLRHTGCTFCKEALGNLSDQLSTVEKKYKVTLITMSPESDFQNELEKLGLEKVKFLSDPDRNFYLSLGLKKGNLIEIFGPNVWIRGIKAFFNGYGISALIGDGYQMPGAFLIEDFKITKSFYHKSSAELLNLKEFIK